MESYTYPVRKSIRLKEYDYSQAGAYFLTICTNGKECLFGHVTENRVFLSEAGDMINRWWNKITNKFPGVELDEFVIIPNHFHGIVILGDKGPQYLQDRNATNTDKRAGQEDKPTSLHAIVQWFKTMTTNEYIFNVKQNKWVPFDKRLWQRNYYEHIIRNETDMSEIREYIVHNPIKWELDEENPTNP